MRKMVLLKDDFRDTALHLSACQGEVGVVKLLLARGADVDAENNLGSTPLNRAAVAGRTEVRGGMYITQIRAATFSGGCAMGAALPKNSVTDGCLPLTCINTNSPILRGRIYVWLSLVLLAGVAGKGIKTQERSGTPGSPGILARSTQGGRLVFFGLVFFCAGYRTPARRRSQPGTPGRHLRHPPPRRGQA